MINAKLPASEKNIQVKGAARLPGGHVKLFTGSRSAAKWLVENRNGWSELADPDFVTSVAVTPVVLHAVPVLSNLETELFIETLVEQNVAVNEGDIHSFRWLGRPGEANKGHGSVVLDLKNKELARKIAKGGLFYNYEYLRGAKYDRPSVIQCFRCLETGHIAARWNAPNPTCVRCGDDQDLRECPSSRKTHVCVRCVKQDKAQKKDLTLDTDDEAYAHSATSAKCPLRSKKHRAPAPSIPPTTHSTPIEIESC
ncbi:hypothetical protein CROQUDRAFT_40591 [Cronartium quercuum f. sp. fusiforme G11]|uniref:CCHC-type domain-containing protein n=1 Tax=Cronartium quercuum f. sp. fusiforme G11 TaxID=708437 RepID=A0A9P6NMY3_9BASI|nr:hypothetical protein CROQUDRAFT_40591 [Cronartium quercuum f. sp. fusiforme G11]